jgi:hypothetical protein
MSSTAPKMARTRNGTPLTPVGLWPEQLLGELVRQQCRIIHRAHRLALRPAGSRFVTIFWPGRMGQAVKVVNDQQAALPAPRPWRGTTSLAKPGLRDLLRTCRGEAAWYEFATHSRPGRTRRAGGGLRPPNIRSGAPANAVLENGCWGFRAGPDAFWQRPFKNFGRPAGEK